MAAADVHSAEFHAEVLSKTPAWDSFQSTGNSAHHLGMISTDMSPAAKKAILAGEPAALRALLATLTVADDKAVQWSLAMLYDTLRDDGSIFDIFGDVLKEQTGFYKLMMGVLRREPHNSFIADKAAWLLSAVIGNVPAAFSNEEVTQFLSFVDGNSAGHSVCSEFGALDAIVNLLKANNFRGLVMGFGPKGMDFGYSAQNTPPPMLYKKIFVLWLLSYEAEGSLPFGDQAIAQKLKDVFTYCRVEKVVRIGLTCLRSYLGHRAVADQIVELGLLEVVQGLEFEKWRDAELYEDIRDMSAKISTRVQEMSSFDRYERELKEGKLKWGFIHSSKFWADNVLKFEQNDFRALKTLAALLHSSDLVTLAVACHDVGEFVTCHPLGKKQIQNLGVKDQIMKLMSSSDQAHKEVRREALLSCQKIMLNKWQDVEGTA